MLALWNVITEIKYRTFSATVLENEDTYSSCIKKLTFGDEQVGSVGKGHVVTKPDDPISISEIHWRERRDCWKL